MLEELGRARGENRLLDAAIGELEEELAGELSDEAGARRSVERMGVASQASLLVRHAPAR